MQLQRDFFGSTPEFRLHFLHSLCWMLPKSRFYWVFSSQLPIWFQACTKHGWSSHAFGPNPTEQIDWAVLRLVTILEGFCICWAEQQAPCHCPSCSTGTFSSDGQPSPPWESFFTDPVKSDTCPSGILGRGSRCVRRECFPLCSAVSPGPHWAPQALGMAVARQGHHWFQWCLQSHHQLFLCLTGY